MTNLSTGDGRTHVSSRRKHIASDVAVIAGISLAMLVIKALKIFPSIPFAPGYQLVLLTPLYIVASVKTRSRFGGTLTGLVMGSVAFLLGDGRYGIFEILKHVAPGAVCDLVVPRLMYGDGAERPGLFAWSLVGGLIGAARFATIFIVTSMVQASAIGILAVGLPVHTLLGVLSGIVSYLLLKRLKEFRRGEAPATLGDVKSAE